MAIPNKGAMTWWPGQSGNYGTGLAYETPGPTTGGYAPSSSVPSYTPPISGTLATMPSAAYTTPATSPSVVPNRNRMAPASYAYSPGYSYSPTGSTVTPSYMNRLQSMAGGGQNPQLMRFIRTLLGNRNY